MKHPSSPQELQLYLHPSPTAYLLMIFQIMKFLSFFNPKAVLHQLQYSCCALNLRLPFYLSATIYRERNTFSYHLIHPAILLQNISVIIFFYFIYKGLYFQRNFEFTTKVMEGTEFSDTFPASPVIHTLYQSGSFDTIDELTLIFFNLSNSAVQISIYSWYFAVSMFLLMHPNVHITLQYHTKQLHCPKNPVLSLFSPPPPLLDNN